MLPHAFKDNEANYEYEDEKPTVAVARAMATRKFKFFNKIGFSFFLGKGRDFQEKKDSNVFAFNHFQS